MSTGQAFRVAAVCWAIYALVTTLPVLSYPSLLGPAIGRAVLAFGFAALFWFRPGRVLAIVGTILGFFSIPLAVMAVMNLSAVGPAYLLVSAAGFLAFVSSAYCWWLTTKQSQPSN